MARNSLRDNFSNGSVGDFLKSLIETNSKLSFVTAYFTIYAYDRLRTELDSVNSLRLLFGEPSFIKNVSDTSDVKNFEIDNGTMVIPPENRLQQKLLALKCSKWIEQKVEIKSMVRPKFLHGKMYHVERANGVQKAISGSSNFTVNGLGLGPRPNIELNMVVNDQRDLDDLKEWFDKLWNNEMDGVEVEDVKDEVLKYIKMLHKENSPEFVYYKTLFHVFDYYLNDQEKGGLLNEKTGFYDSEIWDMLYPFQKDGVKGAINKILNFNGCIIADSVGLGKTFEALAVIRYFELLNKNVLVICPKNLSENWTIYQSSKNSGLNPFKKDKFNYHVLYHTDMGRKVGHSSADSHKFDDFQWGIYDLVVIDESHHFRGNPKETVDEDGKPKKNRARWLMDKILKSGAKTKVLLLSATPVNNNLRDLRNQIYLITHGDETALKESTQIPDIGQTLSIAQSQFTQWADPKKTPNRNTKDLIQNLGTDFTKLLDTLTIARSRKHITKFYDLKEIGKFPHRLKPDPIYPDIDIEDRFFSYDILNKKISEYKLSIFNPSAYVKEDRKPQYGIKTKAQKEQERKEKEEKKRKKKKGETVEANTSESNFDQSDREHFLIGMMKVNFLKRLESSIESFQISMDRTIKKIDALIFKIDNYKKDKSNKAQVIEESDTEADIDIEDLPDSSEASQVGKLKFQLNDLHIDEWLKDLKSDKAALTELYNSACAITEDRDAKLRDLKNLISKKIKNPLNPGNKKIIVFTAYADTAEYLYTHISAFATQNLKLHSALIAGGMRQNTFSYRHNDFHSILTNFSPLSKNRARMSKMPQVGEIDILIATDCISEGQNLQDCDYLINYDIHWNPVRIIQRFGRIDRLGSKNDKIQLVNFWPTKDLDNYINLKERVESRMALVDVTATGEENILNTEQIEELITDDLKFRSQQLKRLKDEVLDLEDMNDSISFTDFTLDDFRIDLTNFIDQNRKELESAPLGIYAIVPHTVDSTLFNPDAGEVIKPGVIFCLRQTGDTSGNEKVNPLQPYFLVYVRDDKTVRYNFTNARQILDIYRLLCTGRKEAIPTLYDWFNEETQHGQNMDRYVGLLHAATAAIISRFKNRNLRSLTESRSGTLIPPDKGVDGLDQFELITWLVIK